MVLMVEKAQEPDIQRLLDIMYAAFSEDAWNQIMFPETPGPEARGASIERWRDEISTKSVMRFMKAVDTDIGEIIAFARWNVYEVERPESEWNRTEPRSWDEGTNVKAANEFYNATCAKRQNVMGGKPHCCLNMLVCDPRHQRRGVSYIFGVLEFFCPVEILFLGRKKLWEHATPMTGRATEVVFYLRYADSEIIKAGRMLLRWGLNLADKLMLEAYLEASSEGHHLYESAGFEDVETVDMDMSKYGKSGIHQHFVMIRAPQPAHGPESVSGSIP